MFRFRFSVLFFYTFFCSNCRFDIQIRMKPHCRLSSIGNIIFPRTWNTFDMRLFLCLFQLSSVSNSMYIFESSMAFWINWQMCRSRTLKTSLNLRPLSPCIDYRIDVIVSEKKFIGSALSADRPSFVALRLIMAAQQLSVTHCPVINTPLTWHGGTKAAGKQSSLLLLRQIRSLILARPVSN